MGDLGILGILGILGRLGGLGTLGVLRESIVGSCCMLDDEPELSGGERVRIIIGGIFPKLMS